jgi:hypothetical protein
MIDIKKFLLDVLKNQIDADINLSTGRYDDAIEKSILIQNRQTRSKNTSFNQCNFSQNLTLIVNWNNNYTETRENVLKIYEVISNIKNIIYDENTLITKCVMESDFPEDKNNNKQIYTQQFNFKLDYVKKPT